MSGRGFVATPGSPTVVNTSFVGSSGFASAPLTSATLSALAEATHTRSRPAAGRVSTTSIGWVSQCTTQLATRVQAPAFGRTYRPFVVPATNWPATPGSGAIRKKPEPRRVSGSAANASPLTTAQAPLLTAGSRRSRPTPSRFPPGRPPPGSPPAGVAGVSPPPASRGSPVPTHTTSPLPSSAAPQSTPMAPQDNALEIVCTSLRSLSWKSSSGVHERAPLVDSHTPPPAAAAYSRWPLAGSTWTSMTRPATLGLPPAWPFDMTVGPIGNHRSWTPVGMVCGTARWLRLRADLGSGGTDAGSMPGRIRAR